LLRSLRVVAEHNGGLFPAKFDENQEVKASLNLAHWAEMQKVTRKHDQQFKATKQLPPEWRADIMKTVLPLWEKWWRGIQFYTFLRRENNGTHCVGGGVKLGTPDRPILWYQPTGAKKYRVIYADLSVKEMSPEEAKKLSEARPK